MVFCYLAKLRKYAHGKVKAAVELDPDVETASKIGKVRKSKLQSKFFRGTLKLFLRFLFFFIVALVSVFFSFQVHAYLVYQQPCVIARNSLEIVQKGGVGRLPKIIHQQWKTESLPSTFANWRRKWLSLFPETEYQHILWTDATTERFIEGEYPWFIDTYRKFNHNIQRADASRYFILYHYGGLYADLDYEPLINFWDYLPKHVPSVVESPYWYNNYERVQNSFMSSPARNRFWNLTFALLIERQMSLDIINSTGPGMLGDAMDFATADMYHILPCQNFHRVPTGKAFNAPLGGWIMRQFVVYTPLVRNCGNWKIKDDCHFGIHHNSGSWSGHNIEGK